jgi:hypothetical protein
VKSTWFTTLALSGVAFGVKKLAEAAHEGADGHVGLIVATAAIKAEVVGDYLIHQAHSQHEAQHNETERQALAARNHHLRRGMAAALHRALTQTAAISKPVGLYDALMSNCETLLQQAETDDKALNQLFPVTTPAENGFASLTNRPTNHA